MHKLFYENFARKRKLEKLRRNPFDDRALYPIEKSTRAVAKSISLFSVISILAIISLAYFERKGISAAKAIIAAIELNRATIIHASIGGDQMDMYFLGCGNTLCAAVGVEPNIIHYIDPESYSFNHSQ